MRLFDIILCGWSGFSLYALVSTIKTHREWKRESKKHQKLIDEQKAIWDKINKVAPFEFDKNAIVARYGKEGMTYFTGEFTQSGEGIFSKYPNKGKCQDSPKRMQ